MIAMKIEKKGKVSEYYNPSEIFCCSYAPYFVEALKIRYPEYFKVYQNNRTIKVNDTNEKKVKIIMGYMYEVEQKISF